MKIAFVGMSHLGLIYSVVYAQKGYEVVCIDPDEKLIRKLKMGDLSIQEPHLNNVFEEVRDRLFFTSDYNHVKDCKVVYISRDVSTDEIGNSQLEEITQLVNKVLANVALDSHLIILCQVPPGFTRRIQNNAKCNVLYQVETLVFGNAIVRAQNPERIILGLPSNREGAPQDILDLLECFQCPILQMSYESAELAKISINIFLASSVTTANTLAELCEKLGANWNDIKKALRLDMRIGLNSYLNAGLGISGGNIERDLRTTLKLSQQWDTHSNFLEGIISNSQDRKTWPSKIVMNELNAKGKHYRLAIWGLAYKSNTNSLKNSPSIENINALIELFEISVSDPVAQLPKELENRIMFSKEALSIAQGADALLILTDWDDYRNFQISTILSRLNRPLIIDPYGVLKDKNLEGVKYYTLGARTENF